MGARLEGTVTVIVGLSPYSVGLEGGLGGLADRLLVRLGWRPDTVTGDSPGRRRIGLRSRGNSDGDLSE